MEKDRYKHFKIWQPLLLGLVAAIGFYGGLKVKLPQGQKKDGLENIEQSQQQKILDVWSYVHSLYIDSLSEKHLTDALLKSFLESLDPYSEYISTDDIKSDLASINGTQFSFGTEFILLDTSLYLINVIPGSVASQHGLKNGDQVLALNGHSVQSHSSGWKNVLDSIQLQQLDNLDIKVRSSSGYQLMEAHLEGVVLDEPAVKNAYPVQTDMVYLKINEFTKGVYRQFMQALEPFMAEKNQKNLIIDLRGNRGGLVSEAANILNQFFVEKDILMFKTVGFHQSPKEYKTTGKVFFNIGKIAVLIDSCTASAAELFAMCLQDLKRAKIVGDTSYGKSLVLEHLNLADGSAIRLAVSKFFTKSQRDIQKPAANGLHELAEQDKRKGSEVDGHSNLHGVLPDHPAEHSSYVNYPSEQAAEWIDQYIIKHLDLFRSIVKDQPEQIANAASIDQEIEKAYSLRPLSKFETTDKKLFNHYFRLGLCAWLFDTDLEQQMQLREDSLIDLAIEQLEKK